MLDDMFHRLSSRFTADSGTEEGKSWSHRETAPQRRSSMERGGTGTKAGSVTADGTAADKREQKL